MEKTKEEVLRYLGRQGQKVPEELDNLVRECIILMRKAASFRQVRLLFPIFHDSSGLFLTGTELILKGKDIARHLSGCGQAVLLAATLGAEADTLIHKWKRVDLTRSYVLDACGTQLVEECCDEIQRQIQTEAAASGLVATQRFSPGYGDFLLDIQPNIIAALNADRRIGLTCTEHFILLPRKSITALIGLGEKTCRHMYYCNGCSLHKTCNFRKG